VRRQSFGPGRPSAETTDILYANKSKKEDLADSAVQKSFEGKRLLLVEDNDLNREIAGEILSGAGFLVEEAEDGSVAVEMLQEMGAGYYSLVMMDIQMPVMDGYAATKAIRSFEDKALAGIPIIAMTANAFEEDKRQALEAGMNAHISKPVDVKKLFETLEGII
ncbi:MAG: response regulator, partial [Lachnospiraceae bacterium]|nr:response regulator [Lachnospiraceae bacterium]